MGADVKALEQEFLTPNFFKDMPQKYIDDTHEEAPVAAPAAAAGGNDEIEE